MFKDQIQTFSNFSNNDYYYFIFYFLIFTALFLWFFLLNHRSKIIKASNEDQKDTIRKFMKPYTKVFSYCIFAIIMMFVFKIVTDIDI